MTLRFQREDDVDREVKGGPGLGCGLLAAFGVAAIFLASYAVDAFIFGKSLSDYKKDAFEEIAVGFVILWLSWLLVPKYEEFRLRAKETYGKLFVIEEAVNASKEGHSELLQRLAAIEDKLDAMQRELESHTGPINNA